MRGQVDLNLDLGRDGRGWVEGNASASTKKTCLASRSESEMRARTPPGLPESCASQSTRTKDWMEREEKASTIDAVVEQRVTRAAAHISTTYLLSKNSSVVARLLA